MGMCYRSSYPSLSLNRPPPGAEPPCERADSICSRCGSNDALMPYVKSHHLLSRLTFQFLLLATALQVVDVHLSGAAECEQQNKQTASYSQLLPSLYQCDNTSIFTPITEMHLSTYGVAQIFSLLPCFTDFFS